MASAILWLRRDLRLADHPALQAAAADGRSVVALFVLDPGLLGPAGSPRVAFLLETLRSLDARLAEHGGGLVVRAGHPERVVPALVRELGADSVHISADFGPYGAARDQRVEDALAAVPLIRTGSPYAVAPGRVVKADDSPYRVFTPFYRAWLAHGWRAPARSDPAQVAWQVVPTEPLPPMPALPAGLRLPEAGEAAAHQAWQRFRRRRDRYPAERDRPDLDHTSRLSPYLKLGVLHPRSLLAGLDADDETFRRELAWREFYAAVLHFWPASAREYFQPELAALPYSTGGVADRHFQAWTAGRTGYPIVDAGMRQLLGEGWVHNRVRMIVASFLVKDLHIEWTRGARYFMTALVDGDLASNQHGWQWTAGTGTDAAPYFRVFNPIKQGQQFDPDGAYIRRWVPELADLKAPDVHQPWLAADGPPAGYPAPIVDHGAERAATLDAYQRLRGR